MDKKGNKKLTKIETVTLKHFSIYNRHPDQIFKKINKYIKEKNDRE